MLRAPRRRHRRVDGAFLEDAFIPHVKNPPKGYLATANTEQVGSTLDNDPHERHAPERRADVPRVLARPGLPPRAHHAAHRGRRAPLALDDLAPSRATSRSAMGASSPASILTALEHADAEQKTPGTYPYARHRRRAGCASRAAPIAEVKDLLARWGSEADYDAASGMSPTTTSPSPDAKEAMASRATTVFNAWLVAMIHATFDDELATVGASVRVRLEARARLADDRRPEDAEDLRRRPRTTRSCSTTRARPPSRRVTSASSRRSSTRSTSSARASERTRSSGSGARLHAIRFRSLVSIWRSLSIPPNPDPLFPLGFPRHGDGYNVDVAGYSLPAKLDDMADFTYSHGPTQRLVIDMDPKGPVARNALPGGNVWDSQDPHFRDEAERWRRNQNRDVPFAAADVIGAAESRIVVRSPVVESRCHAWITR